MIAGIRFAWVGVVACVGVLSACSSEKLGAAGSGGEAGRTGSGGAAGSPDGAAAGCANGAPICFDTPQDGFVIQSVGTTIAAGQDVQYCEIVALPGTAADTFYVSRIDGRMTRGSHHLNVMAIEPGSPADGASTPGQRVECTGNGRVPFGRGLHQIFGAVSPENSLVLPDGVGHVLHGAQKVIFNYHYFNSSTAGIPAKAVLAFHTTAAANVRRELRRFGLYNTGFSIPASGSASFTAECMMAEDVQILSLFRHTHRWGKDFTVRRSGGATDGQPVFVSTNWEEGISYEPPQPFIVKKGEGLRFECAFDNTTDHVLRFGELISDEMCILYGNLVSTKDNVPSLPEDCMILNSPAGQVVRGAPCAQCPDGE